MNHPMVGQLVKREDLAIVIGGEDSYVQQKGPGALTTRTVLGRASVVYILVVPIAQHQYLQAKVTQ